MNARASLLLVLIVTAAAFAQDDNERTIVELFTHQMAMPGSAPRPKQLDPKRIINESSSFLKEREPEMTAEEYAVYDKISTLLTTNADLGVKMLEAMMNDKEPPSPAFAFILGNAYYAANDLTRAEKNYQSALQRYPTFLRAWTNLGVLYYTQNRFADATRCFGKAIALGDHDPGTYGLLGYSLEQQGDTIGAETAYLQAVTGDPTNTDWKEGLLRIYIGGKQYGRAEPLVRNLIKAKPADTRYWLDYAGILVDQHRKVEAIVVLEEATAAGATDADVFLLLGDLYAEQNLTAPALNAYEKVLGTARDRGEEKLLQLARLLTAANKFDEAEQTLAAANPGKAPAAKVAWMRAKADLLMARQRWPEARQQIEALLAISPLDGHALLTLGRTYLEEKNLARATIAYEEAFRDSTTMYQASLELANIELRNRHYAKAVEYLERAQSLEKTDAVADYLARVRTLVPRDGAAP